MVSFFNCNMDYFTVKILQIVSSLHCLASVTSVANEPVREKTNNLGSPPGLIQTGLYSHRRQLEA